MSWAPIASVEISKSRAGMLDRARDYFRDHDVLEVTTPALQKTAATDAGIASIEVNRGGRANFLHSSPEYSMKRMLAAGYPDIFQICNVFREGEFGHLHLPEFTMIEWYRSDFTLREIMQDALDLTASLLSNKQLPDAEFVSYASAFETTLSIDPLTASSTDLAETLAADQNLRNSIGDDRDAWLDLAISTRVSEGFPSDRLTVLHHYPASQAALSRICPDDSRFADRFELFWGKIELANGFVELTDADEQLNRFAADNQKRSDAGLPVLEIDNELIDALRAGLPPCAGVALGLDRVLMINEDQNDVRNVTTFLPGGNNDR